MSSRNPRRQSGIGQQPGIARGLPTPQRPVRRRISAEEIERLATIDAATPMPKGVIRSMLRKADDPTDPARPFAEMLLAGPVREDDAQETTNPTRIRPMPSSTPRRPLSAVDLAWLQGLPSTPADVPARDVARLAEMFELASTESERRLLERVFIPIKQHHDRLEAQAAPDARQRTPALGHRNATTDRLAREALAAQLREERQLARANLAEEIQEAAAARRFDRAARLQEERDALPELTNPESMRLATERLQGLWGAVTEAHEQEVDEARRRLAEIETSTEPGPPTPHDQFLAGQDRARRDDRPQRSPLDYAKVLG